MKKIRTLIFLFLLVLLVPFLSFAVEWNVSDKALFQWDVVEDVTNDNYDLAYEIYVRDEKEEEIFLGIVSQNQSDVPFPIEGRFVVGVRTVLISRTTNEIVNCSEKSWSDVTDDVFEGNTFGFKYFKNLSDPTNLKPLNYLSININTNVLTIEGDKNGN